MSALVPNIPVELSQALLTVNSRELGIGFFRVVLRVRDDAGNESTNLATADVFISRGDEAVAILRSPPIALAGRAFPLFGAESFTKGGGAVITYVWTLTSSGNVRTFRTKQPTVQIGGPKVSPLDPLPRDLEPGKYRIALAVMDDSGALSEPDEHPLLIVSAEKTGRRPIAVPQFLANGQFAERIAEGTAFELDASNSVPASVPGGLELDRFLWTWMPVGRTTPDHSPWQQVSVSKPSFRPDWKLVPGLHRFRLVVFDVKRVASDPVDLVVRVNAG